ncbi:UDP-glycosyltransferase 79A6-like [Vicia villosa]|uniref:UDP-glycosyltransferase 79A6-like n=1 Tax=Vicia villosa TaxID=3911 RepID=UPI00273B7E39|nr:UDP-glycosyltransferase 79A6-like [Vicia villosa]
MSFTNLFALILVNLHFPSLSFSVSIFLHSHFGKDFGKGFCGFLRSLAHSRFVLLSVLSLQTFQARTIFMMIFQRYGNNPTGSDRVIQILSECSLIVFKSCREIEGPYIDHFQNQLKKPVLVSGVLVPEPSTDVLDEKWTKWLDNFPEKSVILCSFGSETFLSDEQISELAIGLELTNLPFILVLNFPSNLNAEIELERALPKVFRERE